MEAGLPSNAWRAGKQDRHDSFSFSFFHGGQKWQHVFAGSHRKRAAQMGSSEGRKVMEVCSRGRAADG
jgi:hypothetical protein